MSLQRPDDGNTAEAVYHLFSGSFSKLLFGLLCVKCPLFPSQAQFSSCKCPDCKTGLEWTLGTSPKCEGAGPSSSQQRSGNEGRERPGEAFQLKKSPAPSCVPR